MGNVEYRELPEFPYYRIGSDGSVWSCNYGNKARATNAWRKMNPTKHVHGHLIAKFRVNKKYVYMYVHRLVAMAFLGPIPEGKEVCHNDGVPSNNIPSNLRYDTRWGNLNDRYRHGTINCGIRQGHSKINDAMVRKIFQRHANGETYKDIGRDFGITTTTVYAIIKRITWRHVPIDPKLQANVRPSRNRKILSRSNDLQPPLQSPTCYQPTPHHLEKSHRSIGLLV